METNSGAASERGAVRANPVLVIVDVQERLVSAINGFEEPCARIERLVKASDILGVPTIVTEQYPQGLGRTVDRISGVLPAGCKPIEKSAFSCWQAEGFAQRLAGERVIVAGIETHICVQQTALEGVSRGYTVTVPADAVAARRQTDHTVGLDLMRSRGVYVSTIESILFDLLGDSTHPAFKEVTALL